MSKLERIQFKDLYQELLDSGAEIQNHHGYEVICCNGIKIKTEGNRLVKLLKLSRHKTTKHLVKIDITSQLDKKAFEVTVTTDHVCMIYNRDHFFENVAAKDLAVDMYVALYDYERDIEVRGTINKITDLGPTADYVYDCEVDDQLHSFYANDVLIHNSQFVDIQCVVDFLIKKYGLPEKIRDWSQEKRQELWDIMSKFVDEEVNQYVRDLVHSYCKTNEQNVLTYELEYMCDTGIYESKKHYYVHKIFEEGDAVDKVKVTGISLKKGETDKAMKSFLSEIYEGVVLKDWTEQDYTDYILDLYEKFKTFSIDEVSFWKGYGTERESVGFLQMAKGATGISKACTYYNQILKKLNLGKKYDELRVGDKTRFCYVKDTNPYGIDCIAYKPGQWPKEFDNIFEVDYQKMFNKIILDQIKRMREACGFGDIDPSKQVVQDVFAL